MIIDGILYALEKCIVVAGPFLVKKGDDLLRGIGMLEPRSHSPGRYHAYQPPVRDVADTHRLIGVAFVHITKLVISFVFSHTPKPIKLLS